MLRKCRVGQDNDDECRAGQDDDEVDNQWDKPNPDLQNGGSTMRQHERPAAGRTCLNNFGRQVGQHRVLGAPQDEGHDLRRECVDCWRTQGGWNSKQAVGMTSNG